MYVGILLPALVPFTFHWYWGDVPSLAGVAVKVTELPEQKGFADATMDIPTSRFGLTVMVMLLLVAGFPVGQTAFEVRTQLTISPFAGI